MGMYSETVQYVQCVTVYSTYCGHIGIESFLQIMIVETISTEHSDLIGQSVNQLLISR